MFYIVTANTELAYTESIAPRGNNKVRFLQASGHIIFVNWSVHNLVLCALLFKDTLFNLYYWFINIELIANSSVTHACMKLI